MKIGELTESVRETKGKLKLRVRVPARLQEKLGTKVQGTYAGLCPKERGNRVQLVYVTVNGKRMTFRPQDLTISA